MTKRMLIVLFAAGLMAPLSATFAAATAAAQERTSPAPAPPPPPPAPPAAPGRPVPPNAPPPPAAPLPPSNVQLDIVITDTISGKAEAKALVLVMRSGAKGSVRTSGNVFRNGTAFPVSINIDAHVQQDQQEPDLIAAWLTFGYQAAWPSEPAHSEHGPAAPAEITAQLGTFIRVGRKLLVSRSADPLSDRTVTVELTATIREP